MDSIGCWIVTTEDVHNESTEQHKHHWYTRREQQRTIELLVPTDEDRGLMDDAICEVQKSRLYFLFALYILILGAAC